MHWPEVLLQVDVYRFTRRKRRRNKKLQAVSAPSRLPNRIIYSLCETVSRVLFSPIWKTSRSLCFEVQTGARYLVIRFFAWKIWITKRSFTAGKHFEVARIVTKFFLFFFYFGLLSDYVSAFSHNSSYVRDIIPFYRKVWWIYARLFVPWKLEQINRLPLSFYNSFNDDANASGHPQQKLFSHQRLCRESKLSYHVVT